MRHVAFAVLVVVGAGLGVSRAEELAREVAAIDPRTTPAEVRPKLAAMLPDHARQQRQELIEREATAWKAVRSVADWETFRDSRLAALRTALGIPNRTGTNKVLTHVAARIDGDGFAIENLVYQSDPGIWVTANLYQPARPRASMPGILIVHSHHTPKHHVELQDMGMTWARAGCLVLVIDQVGHGERRLHPFVDRMSYPTPFRVRQQDYYFRYDLDYRLSLLGESLMSWMVRDLMAGVDLLLARPGVDPKRLILLGSVAGGGDPAAVTAALDPRISAAVPFNFGGPQPETRYPLPADAETSFNYAGSGSWESTRNLRGSTGAGAFPWVIVAATAPRRLAYAHEFRWDRVRDPVWKRLGEVYALYGKPDHLAFTHGFGELSGKAPQASHCTHIGPPHRVMIHAALHRWFGIEVTPEKEFHAELPSEKLRCLTPEIEARIQAPPLGKILESRAEAARPSVAEIRERWARVLGQIEPSKFQAAFLTAQDPIPVERVTLQVDGGIMIPVLLMTPRNHDKTMPVVIGVAQAGKAAFLTKRSQEIAQMLSQGVGVCLVDLRGMGETATGASRGRTSAATSVSSSLQMLGDPVIAGQLRDLRTVLCWLRTRREVDPTRIGLWGESFASVNKPDVSISIPREMENLLPAQAEPAGPLLSLLASLFEPEIKAVLTRGGIAQFRSCLAPHLVLVPHDSMVPGIIKAGDVPMLAAARSPRPLRMAEAVDGLNRPLPAAELRLAFAHSLRQYQQANAEKNLSLGPSSDNDATWLIREMKR